MLSAIECYPIRRCIAQQQEEIERQLQPPVPDAAPLLFPDFPVSRRSYTTEQKGNKTILMEHSIGPDGNEVTREQGPITRFLSKHMDISAISMVRVEHSGYEYVFATCSYVVTPDSAKSPAKKKLTKKEKKMQKNNSNPIRNPHTVRQPSCDLYIGNSLREALKKIIRHTANFKSDDPHNQHIIRLMIQTENNNDKRIIYDRFADTVNGGPNPSTG